ncbi:thyroid receptor-interacting protein 11 [Aplochiton taeniatus]
MSSWLGGLGSGLGQSLGQVGGSLSSITGQISNFTKDMLLEGVEEVGDTTTELHVSNSRLEEIETSFTTQKSEYERLRKIHAELEEKLEAAEIQINRQSADYRTMLQQKDVEISHLKARQRSLQEEVQNLQYSAQSASLEPAVLPVATTSATTTTTTSSSFLPHPSGSHQGFHGDEMDLSDVIWSQQEINRLSTEVMRLESEVNHWRRMSQASNTPGTGNGDQSEIKLQRTIKELREQVSREVDEHQHELTAIQDAQRQKLGEITRRHRDELAEYEERIEELEEQLQNGGGGAVQTSSPADSSKLLGLESTIQSLQEEAGLWDEQVRELTSSLQEAEKREGALQLQKDDAQAENAELLQNYTRLQTSVTELQTRVQEQEGKALHKVQQDCEIQGLKKTLAEAEEEILRLKNLIESEPKAEVEHADILELNTVIDSLRKEKETLEQEKLNLEERLKIAAEKVDSGDGGPADEELGDLRAALEKKGRTLRETQEERDTLLSELEELDRQNQEATQHLISVKDQLSRQLKNLETEVATLSAELNDTKDQRGLLEQELESQKAKLSQSAFTLNDLHMGRQQLESTVKELREALGHGQEQTRDRVREVSELQRTLREKEEQLSSAKAELCEARESGNEGESKREDFEENERDISDLRRELAEVRNSQEKVMSEDYEIKIENRKLSDECEQARGTAMELSRQMKDSQAALNRVVLEKDTLIEAVKLQKSQLEGELGQAERSLAEQAKQYQQTVEEMTRARSMDATALQTEHERAIKINQEKDLEIAQLRREIEQMASDHRDTNEMLSITVAGQKQLTDLLQEKDSFMETIKQNADDAVREIEGTVQTATQEVQALRHVLEEKDRQLGGMKEENSHLKEEFDRFRDQQSRSQPLAEPRTLDIITELETEITQLKSFRDALKEEVQSLRRTSEEQRASLLSSQQSLQAQQSELEQSHSRHEQSILNYDRLIQARDQEIAHLQQAVGGLNQGRGAPTEQQPPVQEVVILQEDKTQQSLNGENGNEKHDLSKGEIERLVKGIKEKETEISQLNEKNLSLAKQLDQMVVSRDEMGKLSQMVLQKDLEIQALHARVSMGGAGHNQDVLLLQQHMQAYAVEREQLLAVLNEKTRENSQLRSDYHRIMDIVAGKEAALMKLQQENQRLSTLSDPTGSQEMFRETIQNLSRIIREKDIEIDALTQKCQTLVTVLQASGAGGADSGGVSSNQFEELLHERDTLKQQVKKMEEWKQQVITTVKNMQHESAQLHEELVQLQGQVSADSDCSSQLSVDYSRLIQSYEYKERRLGSLSQELAQVQQTISQLSSTKDTLLGKLDTVAQTPEAPLSEQLSGPVVAAEPPSHPGAVAPGNHEGLQQEIQRMRALLAERETTIRTLQENNHRLSNSASASESEQRGQAEETRQVRERLDTLQRSVREKDLLIKTKGDQLSHVSGSLRNRESDNEVLKQAVTNLKERALILELDVKKLKEENELVAARSREKESEFRALQETNMQVSLLLREKEFERSSMSEKAEAMEKMLKDKEQGKSGELNQLLNEMRSMQGKAVAFQQERDQLMLALKQKQMETTAVQSELQHMKDKEQRSKLELDRLRNHLLDIEDSYTREAMAAEDREADLRKRVALLDDRLATSSSAVENASQQASLQVESLQEQLNGVVRQRDDAVIQLHTSQEQVNQYAVSLTNLQMVLEQFQQEEKAMYSSELDKIKREKDEWRRKALQLEDRASSLQINLEEANAALDSASRLTDQLDLKEELIEDLKRQLDLRQEMLEEAQNKLMNLLNSTEGKVDKVLMRNLFMGYFHTPKNKRLEVLSLMGNVLGLDREEVDKMLTEDGRQSGWMSSWLGGRAVQSVPNTPQRPTSGQGFNTSFSEMFVKFLEVESTPALPPPKMSMLDMKTLGAPPPGRTSGSAAMPTAGKLREAWAAANKRAGDSNPFLAPRSAAVPLLGSGGGNTGGAGGGHLLMKPISEALPTFTPVPVSAENSGGAVLKDLLKQ